MGFSVGRLSLLKFLILITLLCTFSATNSADSADELYAFSSFDTSLLSGGANLQQQWASLSAGVQVLEDVYYVDIYLNNRWGGRFPVNFRQLQENQNARPCFTERLAQELNMPDAVLSELAGRNPDRCPQLEELVDGATIKFEFSSLKLDVTIPQALMGDRPRGEVPRDQWQSGAIAGFFDYRLNSTYSEQKDNKRTQLYASLNSGVNIGLWRIRQRGVARWQDDNKQGTSSAYKHIDAYVQRAIEQIDAEVAIGDIQTEGTVFDSYAIRGVTLATDDRMWPQSQRGFAPVVRGVAMSNAKVSVRQKGIEIYQTNVPPGPFEIKDLYPTGYGGDLVVTIEESDGQVKHFTVAYSALDRLVRPGQLRYSASVGQLRNLPDNYKMEAMQGAAQYGVNNLLTIYGGSQLTKSYQSALFGVGLNTSVGAWALDVSQSHLDHGKMGSYEGFSGRITWSRRLPKTQTRFSFVGYRYSDKDYFSLSDASRTIALYERYKNTNNERYRVFSKKNEVSMNVSQVLNQGKAGTIYGSLSYFDYWGKSKGDKTFQLGYDHHFGIVSLGVNASRTESSSGNDYNSVYVGVSMPLGSARRAPRLSASVTFDADSNHSERVAVSSTEGKHNEFSWNATLADGNRQNTRASAFGSYRDSGAIVNAGVDVSSNHKSVHGGVSGSLVMHSGGVTAGQPLTETIAIVSAKDARGARLDKAHNVKLDRFGNAVISQLRPYYENTIGVSGEGLPLGVELLKTTELVAPYAGAIIKVDLPTAFAVPLVVQLTSFDSSYVKFGTEIYDDSEQMVGLVGQAGLALLRVHELAGNLQAIWQEGSERFICQFDYDVSKRPENQANLVISMPCETVVHVMPGQEGDGDE